MRSYRRRMNHRLDSAAERARRFRWRIRVLSAAFVLMFLALTGRAVYLMAFPGERLIRLAHRQHQQTITLYPKRGAILDRNGVELAMSVELKSIYADPKLVTDPKAAAAALAPLLKVSERKLRTSLQRHLRFVWLERRVTPRLAATVMAKKIPGIATVKETQRFYPNRELAAAVLGFAGIDNAGLEGLELALEDDLNGTVNRYRRLRDARGRNITPEGVLVRQNTDGGSVMLTIDRNIQYAAEQALNASVSKFKAKSGFVVVMDPHTGELLALANAPGYNPNAYSNYSIASFKNTAVANMYEPGSTQKAFLVAAALNDRVVRVDEQFDCEGGNYRIGRNVVHDTHQYDLLTVQEIIQFSSNIGAAKIADRLGKQRLYEYYRAFGFGESTGSHLPGEARGLLRSPKRWSRIGLATHAFGQGMAVTGIQVATALSAIANGGTRMKPYLIQQKRDQYGNVVVQNEPIALNRVISQEVAKQVTDILVTVTQEGGTAPKAAIDGYPVAGKTGTAQKVDPKLKRYARGKFTSSFIGFVPADDPRVVIVAVLDEPGGRQYYGGTVAGPIFADIARMTMRYFGISPRPGEDGADEDAGESLVAQVTRGEDGQEDTAIEAEILALKPVTQGDGEETEEYILPDFSGRTIRNVLGALDGQRFLLELVGSGVAVAQTPKPGEALRSGETLSLVFRPEGLQKKNHKTRGER